MNKEINKERLNAFTDAIAAIAATIMVLNLGVPNTDDWNGILSQLNVLLAYVVSYMFIYLVWYMHHNLFKDANIITVRAFQTLTELRQNPGSEDSYLTAAAIIKKENGMMRTLDAFDSGMHTMDDTTIGGLVGALIGVLGGPIGVLLGGSYGMLLGSALDAGDAVTGVSLVEQTALKLEEGEVAIIGLAFEEDEAFLDERLGKYKTIIARFDAATIAAEVEEAQKLEEEMARQARRELRNEKKAARKEKRAEKKQKLSADWEGFKAKFKKDVAK